VIREIVWSDTARFDLRRLKAWVERNSFEKAASEAKRIVEAVEKMKSVPRLGKRIHSPDARVTELRELMIRPYVIYYSINEQTISIVRLWHYREYR